MTHPKRIFQFRMFGIKKGMWLSQTDTWKSDDSDDSDYDDGRPNPGSSTQLPRKRKKSPKSRKSKQKRITVNKINISRFLFKI